MIAGGKRPNEPGQAFDVTGVLKHLADAGHLFLGEAKGRHSFCGIAAIVVVVIRGVVVVVVVNGSSPAAHVGLTVERVAYHGVRVQGRHLTGGNGFVQHGVGFTRVTDARADATRILRSLKSGRCVGLVDVK